MNTFVIEIGKHILPLAEQNKICPELIVAIALCSESASKDGNPSELFTQCFNAFGLRGKYNNNFVNVTIANSSNPIPCRVYQNAKESVEDFIDFLLTKTTKKGNLKYSNIIGIEDYKQACKVFAEDGYYDLSGKDYESYLITAIEAFVPNGLKALLAPPEVEQPKTVDEKNLETVTQAPEIKKSDAPKIEDEFEEEVPDPLPSKRLKKAFTPHIGKKIQISKADVYVGAYDKDPHMQLSGTFYLSTGIVYNNRVQIVKEIGHINAGVKFLLGFVSIDDIKK